MTDAPDSPDLQKLLDEKDVPASECGTCRNSVDAIKANHFACLERWFRKDFKSRVQPMRVFCAAVARGRLDMVKYLHERDCQINICDAIWSAVLNQHRECADYLLEEVFCDWGRSTVSLVAHLAAETGDLAFLRNLRDKKKWYDRLDNDRPWDPSVCRKLWEGCHVWDCDACA